MCFTGARVGPPTQHQRQSRRGQQPRATLLFRADAGAIDQSSLKCWRRRWIESLVRHVPTFQ